MIYITSIPIIKPNIYTHQYFRRRPIYTHQNGNINTTSYHGEDHRDLALKHIGTQSPKALDFHPASIAKPDQLIKPQQ